MIDVTYELYLIIYYGSYVDTKRFRIRIDYGELGKQ